MLTIEKVLILSEVDIFRGLAEESLADVAAASEEVEFPAGATILSQGEFCAHMYVIASGRVRSMDGDSVQAEYGRGQAVAASCALDPHERKTSALAVEHCLLIRIDHEDLYDLITEDVELAKVIIRSLCRRLGSYTK